MSFPTEQCWHRRKSSAFPGWGADGRDFSVRRARCRKAERSVFDQVFEAIEETDRKKILIVGDSLTSDIRGGNLAQIVTCWYNPNGQKADSTYRIDAQIQDLQEVIPLLSQSW